MESFDSTKRSLYEILNEVHKGKIQLPDFQRRWVWDDNRIKGIIASVAKSFPIGAIMLLETGNENIKFKTKNIEGAPQNNSIKPEMLILDGQQRLTSLYQAIITNKVVNTRNSKGYEIKRWYYIDMKKALDQDTDLEEAIFSINENKIITENIGRDIVLDLTTEENEIKNFMYPVWLVDEWQDWYMKYQEYYNYDREKIIFWNTFYNKVIKNIDSYMLPVIIMSKENPKEAVCQVFEKVNTGGVSLTVFELLTATYAADEFDLKEDWERIKESFKEYKVLKNVSNTDLIQATTLYSTYLNRLNHDNTQQESAPVVSAKRKDMLNLSLSDYLRYRNIVSQGFINAAKILIENHIFSPTDLPYSTQLIPMAAILSYLGNKAENMGTKQKFMRWFWCGVFGELYGSANETRYALDMTQVPIWLLNNGQEPKTIYDANFSPSRLHTLRTRNSAAYKGVYALLLQENTKDWLTARTIDNHTYFSESIDIHHIFPVAWCESDKGKIPREDFDCIINKTPLNGRTNRIVSGDAPSLYIQRLKKHAQVLDDESGFDFDSILKSHTLEPSYLYRDDFYGFFTDRKERILQRIEKSMGKTIARDYEVFDEGVFVESDEMGEV